MEPVDGHSCYHATCSHFVTSSQGSSFGSVWHSSSSGVGPVVRLEWRVALACYLHQAHRRTDLDIAWSGCASLGLVGTGWALPLRRMRRTGRTGRAFRDAMKRARMAQATSTKWAIMILACARENSPLGPARSDHPQSSAATGRIALRLGAGTSRGRELTRPCYRPRTRIRVTGRHRSLRNFRLGVDSAPTVNRRWVPGPLSSSMVDGGSSS
jgi:hypothetical protein